MEVWKHFGHFTKTPINLSTTYLFFKVDNRYLVEMALTCGSLIDPKPKWHAYVYCYQVVYIVSLRVCL